jgi:hypothetical protein
MSSKKKMIVESIDNNNSNSSSGNRNDVKMLMNTLMKIIKSNNNKNAIDDKRETIIDILNQLKCLPLVSVVDIDDNDDDGNYNNNDVVQAKIIKKKGKIVIEKLFMKLRKLNTDSVIETLVEELLHKCKHDDKGHVSKVSTREGDDKDDISRDAKPDGSNSRSSNSNGENVKMKKVISSSSSSSSSSKDDNNQIGVRKTSRVVKNKLSTYNEDELAEQNIIIDSTSVDGTSNSSSYKGKSKSIIEVSTKNQPIPIKNKDGILYFPDYPQFKPNLTPKEILQLGSFGGTYFRVIHSGVTGQTYHDAWKEFPIDWYDGLDIKKYISSPTYDKSLNYYKAKCGGDLNMWESSGWITEVDPFIYDSCFF